MAESGPPKSVILSLKSGRFTPKPDIKLELSKGAANDPKQPLGLSGECPVYPETGRSGGSISYLLRGCF